MNSQVLRCSAGIAGLDDVLNGGFPRDRLYLVQGDPGVGKTTLALQFLLEGQKQGESGLYVTLSETQEELKAVAESHGWSLAGLSLFELSSIEGNLSPEAQNTLLHPSEVELTETIDLILDQVKAVNPTRVVFDSLSELRLLAQNPLRYRRELLSLKQFFAKRHCTVLLLDDRTGETGDLQMYSLAHGVLVLEQVRPEYGAERRRLTVLKIRGSKFRGGYHDYAILTGGLEVYPRLIAAEHHSGYGRDVMPSGVAELDQLLGGGADRGTSNLFLGPAGTGKSSLALQYALAAARRGERAVYYAFDESVGVLIARAEGLGMHIGKFLDNGLLRIQQVDPAELSPGEFTHQIRRAVEQEAARVVIIDTLNGYQQAMPGERYLMTQLHELLSYLGQQGILTILVLAQQGLVGTMHNTVDLSYLADTVLLLRYFEAGGAVRKAISVIKKRSGRHEDTIREFSVDHLGLHVGKPLTEFRGILTGTPEYLGNGNVRLGDRDAQSG